MIKEAPDMSTMIAAKLLEIPEVQRLNLRLMQLATFNNYSGEQVVWDLLSHQDLWEGVLMDRDMYYKMIDENLPESKVNRAISLIKLRDLDKETFKRLGYQPWNVDTLFILCKENEKIKKELLELVRGWIPDSVDWFSSKASTFLLGGGFIKRAVLRVWWD
ncbi:hypothetical protein KAW50_03510 [candidate division WOR-3 bacterium]|nr:hypothetical protein [candidate division WOR-3 bacterium]